MAYLKTELSNLALDAFFQFDANDEAILCQFLSSRNGTFTFLALGKDRVEEFSQQDNPIVYLVNELDEKTLNEFGRAKAVYSVQKKMNYIIGRVQFGPLTSYEEGELFELLEKFGNDNSIWNIAVKNHFKAKNAGSEVDTWDLIEGLARQCMDDLFTMVCCFNQDTVIYLLRTVKK